MAERFLRAVCGARYPLTGDEQFAGRNVRHDGWIRICVYSSSGGAEAPKHQDGSYAACRGLSCDKPRGTAKLAGVKGPFRIFCSNPDGSPQLDDAGRTRMGYAMMCHFEVVDEADTNRAHGANQGRDEAALAKEKGDE